MAKYFISATDFGSGEANRNPSRYRVYKYTGYREPWGHIPNEPVTGYMTEIEAEDRLRQLVAAETYSLYYWVAVAMTLVFLTWFVAR